MAKLASQKKNEACQLLGITAESSVSGDRLVGYGSVQIVPVCKLLYRIIADNCEPNLLKMITQTSEAHNRAV